MRAKFKVTTVTKSEANETIHMHPVSAKNYGPNGESEDNDFARYTPGGHLEICVTNPDLIGTIVPGDVYYLDFTKAE